MNREQAEFLVSELTLLFKDEYVVLVESREWEHFIPMHVSLEKLDKISSIQEGQNHVLVIGTRAGLDNPIIDLKTILFTVINGTGKKIYRSFTLARDWKDDQEATRWIRLKYALI
ncbi:MAG: hypothetical protein HYT65_01710 [Candidatus Yanofskybacteria bacterium]|nr:hypothetical protein [Candidatus Yanofskybacteria bacterium]